MMGTEARMGPSEEELKVELPPEEEKEDEEDLFIFEIWKMIGHCAKERK